MSLNVDTKTALAVAGGVVALAGLGGLFYVQSRSGPSARDGIPAKSKALVLKKLVTDVKTAADCFAVEDVDTPVPGPGQVLVKIERSPINPSDVMFVSGHYLHQPSLPCAAGFEGSGVVVQAGGGVLSHKVLGKRVGFIIGNTPNPGVWRQYALIPAEQCIALPDDVSFEEGCSPVVNPGTVLGMIDTIKQRGAKAFIHTAAASQLGRMFIRMAKAEGLEIICVVRREEQAQACKAAGATHILNSTDAKFEEQLKKVATELKATIAFDAVAGDLSGILLRNMPPFSEVFVYGGLSGSTASAGIGDLIAGKKLSGWWLSNYLKTQSAMSVYRMFSKISKSLKTELRTEVVAAYPLDKIQEALIAYTSNMTAGKITVAPFATEISQKK